MSAMRMEFLFVSDVHESPMYSAIVELANEQNVDALVFGGDYIDMVTLGIGVMSRVHQTKEKIKADNPPDLDEIMKQIDIEGYQLVMKNAQAEYGKINELIGGASMPVFGIDGNHDLPDMARQTMTNMHLIDNGETYDFNGIKFGSVVNSDETPNTFAQHLMQLGISPRALFPQIDSNDQREAYSVHDANIAEKFSADKPDIVLAHKAFGNEMTAGKDGESLGYGKHVGEYVKNAGKDVWSGHIHGQLPKVDFAGTPLPVGMHGNAMTYRATPFTAWKCKVDDRTKKTTEIVYYERVGNHDGKWLTVAEYRTLGGTSTVLKDYLKRQVN